PLRPPVRCTPNFVDAAASGGVRAQRRRLAAARRRRLRGARRCERHPRMPTLRALLTDPTRLDELVASLLGLVEREVAAKKGFSGATLKAGYAVVKKLRPGILDQAIRILLPDFADAMQPDFDA